MEISDIRRALGLENLDPEDIDRIKLQLQQINDTIQGGLRSANLKEYRNTYVINAQDSLDADFPMYVHFNIISEMTKIVSIKLSFWLLNFRAYAKAATEKEAVTSGASSITSSGPSSSSSSASGGSSTPTSGPSSASSSGGGGVVSSASGGVVSTESGSGVVCGDCGDYAGVCGATNLIPHDGGFLVHDTLSVATWNHCHDLPGHTHLGGTHTHIGGTHTHNIAHTHTVTIASHTHYIGHTHNIEHTHSVPAHAHGITYGISEEKTSPTIVPSISRNNGRTYSLPIGSYTKDQNLDITRFIDTAGSKMIKFTSNTRARLSVQVTIKLDIKAR